jgi:hypothetical protein
MLVAPTRGTLPQPSSSPSSQPRTVFKLHALIFSVIILSDTTTVEREPLVRPHTSPSSLLWAESSRWFDRLVHVGGRTVSRGRNTATVRMAVPFLDVSVRGPNASSLAVQSMMSTTGSKSAPGGAGERGVAAPSPAVSGSQSGSTVTVCTGCKRHFATALGHDRHSLKSPSGACKESAGIPLSLYQQQQDDRARASLVENDLRTDYCSAALEDYVTTCGDLK